MCELLLIVNHGIYGISIKVVGFRVLICRGVDVDKAVTDIGLMLVYRGFEVEELVF